MDTEKDVLEKEITGEPVTVELGGKVYPLGYPIFAVALYKQETAKLNCRRAKDAEGAGRTRLSAEELKDFKSRFRELARELDDRRDSMSGLEFGEISQEMVEIRTRLDEEAGSGDSLFHIINWWKIRDDDPDRVLLAFWVGLHQEQDGTWKSPFSLGQLSRLVDFSNIVIVLNAITRGLGQYMPKVKSKDKRPNDAGPEPSPAETEAAIAKA